MPCKERAKLSFQREDSSSTAKRRLPDGASRGAQEKGRFTNRPYKNTLSLSEFDFDADFDEERLRTSA
jgi:hypothetical protein